MDMINDATGERAPGHCVGTDDTGRELYSVPTGWTPVEPYSLTEDGYAVAGATRTTKYLIETMPDHLRGSHRAAGNWGVYPHNGAERRIVDECDLPDESDEYDHAVREATERDIERYGEAQS